MYKSSIKG